MTKETKAIKLGKPKKIVLMKVKCDEFKEDLINNFESTTNK
jgi:hypothetical protein